MFVITTAQIKRLANIFDNAGQVSLGTLVLSPTVNTQEYYTLYIVLIGTILTIMLWYFSIKFENISL
jgi:uncharacterized membrane protein YcaP (DUF421 family)